jgi:hypothetical protein
MVGTFSVSVGYAGAAGESLMHCELITMTNAAMDSPAGSGARRIH